MKKQIRSRHEQDYEQTYIKSEQYKVVKDFEKPKQTLDNQADANSKEATAMRTDKTNDQSTEGGPTAVYGAYTLNQGTSDQQVSPEETKQIATDEFSKDKSGLQQEISKPKM